jgi:intracellular sulfur oxidation DsrE/DsrF family protein
MKVVFHIDELEKWEETTKNVKNQKILLKKNLPNYKKSGQVRLGS